MSKKNRFQKSKSRKYRHPYKVRESVARPQDGGDAIANSVFAGTKIERKPKEQNKDEIIAGAQDDLGTEDFTILRSSLRDLRLAMYVSAGFVIFLIALYIVKLETPFFDLAVDYLYKVARI